MLRSMARFALASLLVATLAACGSSSPGPLAGTWKMTGAPGLTTTFRSGEMESMGMIEKVGYKVDGQSVIVTPMEGMLKGTGIRYVLRDATTATTMGLTYRKVQ